MNLPLSAPHLKPEAPRRRPLVELQLRLPLDKLPELLIDLFLGAGAVAQPHLRDLILGSVNDTTEPYVN